MRAAPGFDDSESHPTLGAFRLWAYDVLMVASTESISAIGFRRWSSLLFPSRGQTYLACIPVIVNLFVGQDDIPNEQKLAS